MRKRILVLAGLSAVCLLAGPFPARAAEVYTGDLDKMVSKGNIRVLTTYNKTNFFKAEGQFQGYEYTLLKMFETFARDNGYKIALEFTPVSRDKLIPGLLQGQGDIAAASLTVTDKRLAVADFTIPYITGVSEVVVTHKSVPKPRGIDDLSGKHILVRESSNYFETLTHLNEKLAEKGLPPVIIDKAPEHLETEDILEMVNSGAVPMTAADNYIAEAWAEVLPDVRVNSDVRLRDNTLIAWMVRKDSPKLRMLLDEFLLEHKKSAFQSKILFSRYYKNNPWILNPLIRSKVEKLRDYRKLFVQYGEQYGFDWLVLMAAAFEYSGMDSAKISSAGVGLMQVPPTAAGGRDISSPEANIKAAANWLAMLRDQYFSKPGVAPGDQVRFALAAYRAGPEKITRAREKAEKMGLDPNRWSGHVAIAAQETAGDEVVRSVSNIDKYALIYRLSEEILSGGTAKP